MRPPRVLLADDHRLLREAFARLLEPGCDVVGAVSDGRDLLDAARELRPDIVVLDIAMPRLDGLGAARQLRASMPEVKLIFLTVSEDPDLAAEALRIGASGYLLKNSAASELFRAIDEVSAGRTYVTPLAAGRRPPAAPAAGQLSSRQRQILGLLAQGRTMKEIGRTLSITSRTVAFHKYRMMEGLGIKRSAELVRFAIEHQIVSV